MLIKINQTKMKKKKMKKTIWVVLILLILAGCSVILIKHSKDIRVDTEVGSIDSTTFILEKSIDINKNKVIIDTIVFDTIKNNDIE